MADQLFESAGKEGARELNTLAGLIRPKRDDDTFKLNLFGDRGGGSGGMRGGNAPTRDDVIVFGGDEGNRETGLADKSGASVWTMERTARREQCRTRRKKMTCSP